jgi:hypothetical protein
MKRVSLCAAITMSAFSALYAQTSQTCFVNNTPFTVSNADFKA